MRNIQITINMNPSAAIVLGAIGMGAIALAWRMADKNYALKAGNVELYPTEPTHIEA